MKLYQEKYIDEKKKKDAETAEQRKGPYIAGKVNLNDQPKPLDLNQNEIDPEKDQALTQLIRNQTIKKKILRATTETKAINPNRINLSKEEKVKVGKAKFNEEDTPYK